MSHFPLSFAEVRKHRKRRLIVRRSVSPLYLYVYLVAVKLTCHDTILWESTLCVYYCFPFQYNNNNYTMPALLITANDYYLHLRQYTFPFLYSYSYPVFIQSLGKSNLLSYYDGIMIDMYSVNIIIITVCYPEAIYDFLLPLGEFQISIFTALMIAPYPNRLDQ